MFMLLFLSGKRVMPRLLPAFTIRDGSIHDRKNFVVLCPPEMRTDSGSIISDECNFDVCGNIVLPTLLMVLDYLSSSNAQWRLTSSKRYSTPCLCQASLYRRTSHSKSCPSCFPYAPWQHRTTLP